MDEIQTRLAENRLAKTSVWYMRAGGVCMLADTFIENAKVGKNGQVTIPQSIREILLYRTLKTFISCYGSLTTPLFPSGLLSLNPLLPHPM